MAKHVKISNSTVEEAEHYIRMVGLGDILGLTLVGPAGMGKTHLVQHTLEELGIEYIKYGGHITVASIYEYLFENHNKLIFFDDCSSLVNNTEIMELLKQALSENGGTRSLHYRSKSSSITAPKEFVFEGRIIMAFNAFEKKNPNVKAVMSRAPPIEMKFSRDEIIGAMKEIANNEGGDLLNHEKVVITREIEKYTDATMYISLRHQQQAFRIFNSCKKLYGSPPPADKWKPLVTRLFGKRQESWIKEMVRDAVGTKTLKRKELVRIISIKRSMSPRNAQRKVAEWIEAGEIYQNKLRDGDISIQPFKFMMGGM